MAKSGKFHAEKIYVPREVREILGLKDGDEVAFDMREGGEVVLKVLKSDADQELLKILSRPRRLGVKGKLTREEIYASA